MKTLKPRFNLVFLSFLFLFQIGCAVGPLVVHESARTVGNSNHELAGGYGLAGMVLKWNYGLTENLDLGLQWETFSMGIRAKYAFVNSSAGWSFATALGTGSSVGGSHTYGDLIGSYMFGTWEPYSTFRYVHVKTDPVEFRNANTGQLNFTLNSFDYDYGQVILGTKYWFNPHWVLSMEASSLLSLTSGLRIGNGFLVGAAIGYKF